MQGLRNRGGSRILEQGSSESLGGSPPLGSRVKAQVAGPWDNSPRSWRYSANYATVEESKEFGQHSITDDDFIQ